MQCGLLGRTLCHSYSPQIHRLLGAKDYRLFEIVPEQLGAFLQSGSWDALNVTIPYKKAVLPYCAELSDTVRAIGSANTLKRRPDGSIFADNTDAFGFSYLLRQSGIAVGGKNVLVFGSGGASATVCHVLRQQHAGSITVISRSGKDNYQNLSRHSDAQLLINTTPLGMYPDTGAQPASVAAFSRCEAVVDLIYNPAKTALLLQAQALHIPCTNGLPMLAAQAKRSAEIFTDTEIPDSRIGEITEALRKSMQNIVLIGMPGCGKTTIGRLLAEKTGRPFFDSDYEIEKQIKMPIAAYFSQFGEAAFRDLEAAVLAELGKKSGCVLATGGGAVLREENAAALHQNSVVVWLKRPLRQLPKDGRPLSLQSGLSALYAERAPLYARHADLQTENCAAPEETCNHLLEALL